MNMTITESDKKLLSFLVAFLLAVLFIFLVFRPFSEKNKELKQEIAVTRDQEIAMDMSASLAEDMAAREKSVQEKMAQVMQRFYPMLQSQEAENMVTVLMLNHKLKIQNLTVVMAEKPSELKWYQYSENASADVPDEILEEQSGAQTEEFGIYTARITCTAEGSKEDLMALVDDISLNYPAISILGTEWSVTGNTVEIKEEAVFETEEEVSEAEEDSEEGDSEEEDSEEEDSEEEDSEDEKEKEAKKAAASKTGKKAEQTGGLTISLEIYMCEQ